MADHTTLHNSSSSSLSNRRSRKSLSSIMRTGFFRLRRHVDCFAVGQSHDHRVKYAGETFRRDNTVINVESNDVGEQETGAVFSDVNSPTVRGRPHRRLLKMTSSVSDILTSSQQSAGNVLDAGVGIMTYQSIMNYQREESQRDTVTSHDKMATDYCRKSRRITFHGENNAAHEVKEEQVEQLTNGGVVDYDEFVNDLSTELPLSRCSHCIIPQRPNAKCDAEIDATVELVERKSQNGNFATVLLDDAHRDERGYYCGVTAEKKKVIVHGGNAAGRLVRKIGKRLSYPLSKRDGDDRGSPSDADGDCKHLALYRDIDINDAFLLSEAQCTYSDIVTSKTMATATELFIQQPMEALENETQTNDVEWQDRHHGNEVCDRVRGPCS